MVDILMKSPDISFWRCSGDGELTLPELLDGASKSKEFQNRLRVMDIDEVPPNAKLDELCFGWSLSPRKLQLVLFW